MGDEYLVGARTLDPASRRPDSRAGCQMRLDGFEFDAIAAEFDLAVHAPQVLQVAIFVAANQIARAVDASQLRVLVESLRGQFVAPVVSSRQAHPRNAQLAGLAVTDWLQFAVEDPRLVAAHRPANRHRPAGMHAASNDRDGTLGRPVAVFQPASCGPAVGQIGGQGLAAHVHQPQIGQFALRICASHRAQQRRRRTEHGHPLALQPRNQIRTEPHRLVIQKHQRRPHRKSQPRLLDGRIVGGRRALRDPIVACQAKILDVRRHQVHNPAMLDQHSLRLAGRP